MSNKILITLFLVLLIIIIGEIGYYFSLSNNILSASRQKREPSELIPTLSTSPSINLNDPRDYIRWLQKRASVMVSSTMIDISEGTIKKIQTGQNTNQIQVVLTIKGKNGEYTFSPDLTITKVFQKVNGKIEPFNYKNLKINDRVSIKETFDVMPDQIKTLEILITKISNI